LFARYNSLACNIEQNYQLVVKNDAGFKLERPGLEELYVLSISSDPLSMLQ